MIEIQSVDNNVEDMSSPVKILQAIQCVGCLIMIANLMTESAYLFKNRFSSIHYFSWYVVVFAMKLIVTVILIGVNLYTKVIRKRPKV